jgi:hypothetical protein
VSLVILTLEVLGYLRKRWVLFPAQKGLEFGHVRLWAERDLVLFLKVTHFESRLCSDQMNFLLDMAMNLGFRQTPRIRRG